MEEVGGTWETLSCSRCEGKGDEWVGRTYLIVE